MAEEEVVVELEVLKVGYPVKNFRSIVRESRKRRELRRSGVGKPVEVVTIPDESQVSPQVIVRKKSSASGVPKSYAVPSKKVEESEQGLKGDIGQDGIEITSNGSSGDSTTDDIISLAVDSTNDSVNSTCASGTTDDSDVLSDFMDVSNISTSGTGDSLPASASENIMMTINSADDDDDDSFVLDFASSTSTADQTANRNFGGDEESDDSDSVVPPSPVTPEDSADGMPELCGQLIDGDEADDDVDMPVLFPQSSEQSGDCGEADEGAGPSQVTWMGDEDEKERTQYGKRKKGRVIKKRCGFTKKKGRGKGRALLSLEEARSVFTGRPFWCKLCDTYFRTVEELRGHIEKVHEMDGSLVNRFNVATWDLEIAKTFENPMDLDKAEED